MNDHSPNPRSVPFRRFILSPASSLLLAGAMALATATLPVNAESDAAAPKKVGWIEPVEQQLEGWTVQVDPALLSGEHQEEGTLALAMLANHLQRIAILIPEKPLRELRKVKIRIEQEHPELTSMQYHPDSDWLVEHGYDPQLVKMVHLPRAAALFSRDQMIKHPAVILHELSHAYHDQFLGFEDPGVLNAYHEAMKKGIYDKVLLFNGKQVPHYATTNHKEYFAEATEAYFYRNDFYPFVRAELKIHDPVGHATIEQAWGLAE